MRRGSRSSNPIDAWIGSPNTGDTPAASLGRTGSRPPQTSCPLSESPSHGATLGLRSPRMQDCYAFDVGDFGKLGLLRHIHRVTNLRLGVLWWRTTLGTTGSDGKHRRLPAEPCVPSVRSRSVGGDAPAFQSRRTDLLRTSIHCGPPARSSMTRRCQRALDARGGWMKRCRACRPVPWCSATLTTA